MRVLVTDGDTRAALAITRSLGRRRHEVIVGERHGRALAQTSRYCARRIVYPDPAVSSSAFLEFIAKTTLREGIEVVLPVTDITTRLVTAARDRLHPSCALPFADGSIVSRAADKVDTVETAGRLGVPVPQYVVLSSPADLPDHRPAFPVVIKPARSRVQVGDRWLATAVSFARDAAELVRDLEARASYEFPVLLQERIAGPGIGVFACLHRGRPVALFSHRRLRERPPWGGVSVLCESCSPPPIAAAHAVRLLNAIGWQGVAMVEFKLDVRDGLPKLMEINGRFWGSLQLASDAGVDFPGILLETISGNSDLTPQPYRVGVRNRWLWGDVDSLLVTLFGGDGPARLAAPRRRLAALGAFARLWGRDLYYDNPKWEDPWPWVTETGDWIRRLAAGAVTSLRSGKPEQPARDGGNAGQALSNVGRDGRLL